MTQDPNVPPTTPAADSTTAAPPVRRKRRRWPWVLLILLVGLLLLVALGPTLASIGPVKKYAVGKVNGMLNGHVTVDGYSAGWFSPITAHGIKVYDEQNRLIADVPNVKINLTVSQALRQQFHLGEGSQIDVASFVLNVDKEGQTNFAKLLKTEPKTEAKVEAKATTQAVTKQETKLPDVSGNITLNFQGTVEGDGVQQPVHVEPSNAVVMITNINEPIQNKVKLVYRVGDAQASTLEATGTVDAIQNNLLNIGGIAAGQKISFDSLDLSALNPFLKAASGSDPTKSLTVAGILSGNIDFKADNGVPTSSTGVLHAKGVKVAGGPLGNDQYSTPTFDVPLNVVSETASGERVFKFTDFSVSTSQLKVTLSGQLPASVLQNLKDRKAPGADGTLSINATVTDLPNLANQLRNTLHLEKDVTINSGSLTQSLVLTLAKDRITIAENFYVAAAGTRAGKPVQIQPIKVDASASAIPNGTALPDVRDLKLAMASAFANAQGGGASLAKLGINGDFDLAKLSSEAGQFYDMSGKTLAGVGTFAVNSNGDLTNENAPITASTSASLNNVQVAGVMDQPIKFDRLTAQGSAQITRKANDFEKIDKGWFAVAEGDPAKPAFYAEGNGNYDLKAAAATWFQVKASAPDLAVLQQQFGGVVKALGENHLTVRSGTLYAEAAGSFVDNTLALSQPAYANIGNLTLLKDNAAVLNNETIRSAIQGKFALKGNDISATIDQLIAKSDSGLFDLSKAGDKPFVLEMNGSAIKGGGTLSVAVDINRVADLAQAIGKVVPAADQPKLTSGKLNGTLSINQAEQTQLAFDGNLSVLSVVQGQKSILSDEALKISANITAPTDPASKEPVAIAASIDSSFAKTDIKNVKVLLGPTPQPLAKLQSADITASVPDAAKLASLVNSVSPVLGTLAVTSGSAEVALTVKRSDDTTATIDLSKCNIANLGIARGKRAYTFDAPIQLALSADMKSSADKIESLKINKLDGDLRVAKLTMPKPIYVADPMGTPAVEGSIGVTGSIDAVAPLLAVIQDADPLPYKGTYTVNEAITNKSGTMSLNGGVDVNQFVMLDPATKKPAFTEDQISIKNNLDVDLNKHNARVNTFTLDMPKSQAAGVKFSGSVQDWANACKIAGLDAPQAQLDLTYDAEKLRQLAWPMLSPEMQTQYKDMKVAGKYTKTFKVGGSYNNKPNLEAVQRLATLNGSGALALDLLDLPQGLTIKSFELPLTLEKGIIRTQAAPEIAARKLAADKTGKASMAKTAICNDGALNLDGMAIELAGSDPLLSIERKHVLLNDVALNSVLADTLGQGNLIFKDADQASGLLDVTIVDCKRVPLGDLITKNTKAQAQVMFSVTNLNLDGPVTQVMGKVMNLGEKGIVGNINNGTLTLSQGHVDSNFAINLTQVQKVKQSTRDRNTGDRNSSEDDRTTAADKTGTIREDGTVTRQLPLAFGGGVNLATGDLKDFAVNIPSELIPQKWLGKTDISKILPNGLTVPFTGTTEKFQFDFAGAISKSVGNSLFNVGGEGGQSPQDALKNLGDLLQGGKKKKGR